MEEVFASVLRQLLVYFKEANKPVPEIIFELQHLRNIRSRPGAQHFEDMLKNFVNSFDSVFIVFDGLDEYPNARRGREKLLSLVKRLASSLTNTHMLFTSRREVNIDNTIAALRKSTALIREIDLMDNRFRDSLLDSVDKVIKQGIKQLRGGPFTATTEKAIQMRLRDKADGM